MGMYNCEKCLHENVCDQSSRQMWGNLAKEKECSDFVELVHGHWVKYIFFGHDQFVCSECQTIGLPQWKRCPVCEAKMDGGNEDG